MTTYLPNIRLTAGLALGLLLAAAPAWAQDKDKVKPAGPAGDGKTHRLEIFNGPVRSVHYYADGLTTAERSSLGELQRLENEVAFTDDLGRLRYQYIRDERELQRRRALVQNLLYGNSTTYGSGFYPGPIYGYGYGYGYGLPLGYAYPGVVSTAFYPGYVGAAGTTTQSLAFGMGDEGVIKNEIARALGGLATPAYAAQTRAEYLAALDRASKDERLAGVLGLKRGEPVVGADYERPVPAGMGLAKGDKVALSTRGGEKLEGTFVRESGDWVTFQTSAGQVSLRKGEITQFTRK